MRERRWTLKDVYRELGGSGSLTPELAVPFGPLFNGQARHLLSSAPDGPDLPFRAAGERLGDSPDRVFKLLGDLHTVGIQDWFAQSVRLFADSFGWSHVALPRARRGPGPGQAGEVEEETRALIRAHNTLDAELHAHFSDRLSGSPSVTASSRLRGSAYLRPGQLRRLRGRVERAVRPRLGAASGRR